MPRLFFSNFDFEAGLVSPSACAARDAIRRNSELAVAWLAVARPGDVIVAEHLPDAGFEKALAQLDRTGVRFARSTEEFDDDLVVTPWGWERRVIGWADSCGLNVESPTLNVIARTNSREFSFECEREFGCGIEGQAACCTMEHVNDAVSSLDRWLTKANFGASGRERIVGSERPTEAMQQWIEKRFSRDGAVFVEPYLDSVEEAGIQWELPRGSGPPELIGVVPLLSDDRGQYRGSVIPPGSDVPDQWRNSVEISRRAAEYAQSLGYFGPLGIDAMRYRDASGLIRDRPLQDINARWTMGRLALGWRDLIPENETLVQRAATEPSWSTQTPDSVRRLRISPGTLDGSPLSHVIWLESSVEN